MGIFSSLTAKLVVAAAIIAALAGFLGVFHHKAFVAGENSEMLSTQKQIDKQTAENRRLADALKAKTDLLVLRIDTGAEKQLAAVSIERTVAEKSLVEAAHANPVYAAQRRPAAYERVRQRSFGAVTAAADQSLAAAQNGGIAVPAPSH